MGQPIKCPVCSRVFNWGLDADSTIVEARGARWVSCRENAHWKLTFHMLAEHPEEGFLCPSRHEHATHFHPPGQDYWQERDGHKACSFCGSLSPAEFFAAIGAGYEVTPTDKSYKAYVLLPNPVAGQAVEVGSTNGPAYDPVTGRPACDDLTEAEKIAGRYRRPIMGTAPAMISAKVYFQHLSEEERRQFVDLINERKIKIGYPGHFYVLPFFAGRAA